ncbi:MAG: ABC transporter ATP-binding protein [Deferribacteraceae bacterium]|jgi:putative ABC transport system ATP-binding protein|nr:ABC transporter ATP-binding protein [Deferribacteraceae bacterium]
MSTLIEADNLEKIYRRGNEDVNALNGISFRIEKGEIVTIVGPSGSGKTTLVNILGCLDNPTRGKLTLDGEAIFKDGLELTESELTEIRRKYFGYIFQKFFLIPTLTVRENILLPSVFQKRFKANDKYLQDVLELLGIEKRGDFLPKEISGGELQRVAIARALINNPKILIADEPTGNLDSKRSEEIKELLLELNKINGLSIILVTHNPELAKIGSKTLTILDGKLSRQG